MPLTNLLMKIAGKDPNGNVKGVTVNDEGALKTEPTGSVLREELPSVFNIEPGMAVDLTSDFQNDRSNSFRLVIITNRSTSGETLDILYDSGINSYTSATDAGLYPGMSLNDTDYLEYGKDEFGRGIRTKKDVPIYGRRWKLRAKNNSGVSAIDIRNIEIRRIP